MRIFLSALLILFVSTDAKWALGKDYEEGSRACWTGTSKTIVRGKGDIAMSLETHGTYLRDNEDSPFYLTSFHCVGAGTVVNGKREITTFCEITDKDGDKAFSENRPGVGLRFVGGTGKFEGITGGTTGGSLLGRWAAPEKGHFAGCARGDYKYTIPD